MTDAVKDQRFAFAKSRLRYFCNDQLLSHLSFELDIVGVESRDDLTGLVTPNQLVRIIRDCGAGIARPDTQLDGAFGGKETYPCRSTFLRA